MTDVDGHALQEQVLLELVLAISLIVLLSVYYCVGFNGPIILKNWRFWGSRGPPPMKDCLEAGFERQLNKKVCGRIWPPVVLPCQVWPFWLK